MSAHDRGHRNGWARRAAVIPLLGALLGASTAGLAACQDEGRLEEAAEEARDEVEDAKKELEDEVDDHT